MKKALFVLMFAAIAFMGVSNAENTSVTFKSNTLDEIDLIKNNVPRISTSATADTTKKGGGRGNETPYKGTGGKKETGGNGGIGKTSGGRGDIITYRGASDKKESSNKEIGGNGGAGKEASGKKESDGNNKTEAVIFRQQKNK